MAEAETDNAEVRVYPQRDTKQDIFFFYNTLAGLVKGLEGQYTTVDLRNEYCVTGKVIKVDGRMNMEMRDVIFYDSRGNERVFPQFFLNHRNIRNVHIPKKKTALELIEGQLMRMKPPETTKKKRYFKISRAERYQKETVQSAFADKPT